MNEEALKDAYNLFAKGGYNGNENEFYTLLSENAEAFADSYGMFSKEGYSGSQDDYKLLLGLKKKDSSKSEDVQSQEVVTEVSSSDLAPEVSSLVSPSMEEELSPYGNEPLNIEIPEQPKVDIESYINNPSSSNVSKDVFSEIQSNNGIDPNNWDETVSRSEELAAEIAKIKKESSNTTHGRDRWDIDRLQAELDPLEAYLEENEDSNDVAKKEYDNQMFQYVKNNSTSTEEAYEGILEFGISPMDVSDEVFSRVRVDGQIVSVTEAEEWLFDDDNIVKEQQAVEGGFQPRMTFDPEWEEGTEAGKYLSGMYKHQIESGSRAGDLIDVAGSALSRLPGLAGTIQRKVGELTGTPLLIGSGVSIESGSSDMVEYFDGQIRLSEEKGAVSAFVNGNYNEFAALTANQLVRTGVDMGVASLTGPMAPYTMGAMSGLGKYQELDKLKKSGEIDTSELGMILNAGLTGTAEAIFEKTTFRMFDEMVAAVRKAGGDIDPASFVSNFLTPILPNAHKEGMTELYTQISNVLIDRASGVPGPENSEELFMELMESYYGGFSMLGFSGGATASVVGVGRLTNKLKDKENYEVTLNQEGQEEIKMSLKEYSDWIRNEDNAKAVEDGVIRADGSQTEEGRALMKKIEDESSPEYHENGVRIIELTTELGGIQNSSSEMNDDTSPESKKELSSNAHKVISELMHRMAQYGDPQGKMVAEIKLTLSKLKAVGIEMEFHTETQLLDGTKVVKDTKANIIETKSEAKAVKKQIDEGKDKPVIIKKQVSESVKDSESKAEVETQTFENKEAAQEALDNWEIDNEVVTEESVQEKDLAKADKVKTQVTKNKYIAKAKAKAQEFVAKVRLKNFKINNKFFRSIKAASLGEISIDTFKSGEYFAITAHRGSLSKDTNNKRQDNLKKILDGMEGVEYTETTGVWMGEGESSLIITGLTKTQAINLGNQFNQDAILSGKDGLLNQDGTTQAIEGNPIFGPEARAESGLTVFVDPKTGKKTSVSYKFKNTEYGKTITSENSNNLDYLKNYFGGTKAKILGQIGNLMKIGSGVKFKIFTDSSSLREELYNNLGYKHLKNGAQLADAHSKNNAFFRGKDGFIYVNMAKVNENTLFHEVGHTLVDFIKETDPEAYEKIEKAVENSKSYGKFYRTDNNEVKGLSYLDWAKATYKAKDYRGNKTDAEWRSYLIEEAFAEMIGDASRKKLNPTTLGKVRNLLSEILAKFFTKPMRVDLENLTLGEVADLKGLNNVISDALTQGKAIRMKAPGEDGVIKDFEVKATGTEERFQGDFVDKSTGIQFSYDKNSGRFKELEDSGDITTDKSIKDFEGKFVVTHAPDALFSGAIIDKDGTILVEGKGGVYFPIKFHDDGYFWASTDNAAKSMTKLLNDSLSKSKDGKVRLALTTSPSDKLLSSTAASRGILNLLTSENFIKKIGLNKKALYKSIINAANAKTIDDKGKAVGMNLQLSPNMSNAKFEQEAIAIIWNKLNNKDSSFSDRKEFSETIVKAIKPIINSKEKSKEGIVKLLAQGLEGDVGSPKVGLTSKGKPSTTSLTASVVKLLTEPRLRTETQTKEIYAIIEMEGKVKPVKSDKYDSYGMALVSSEGNKAKVHFLTDRHSWDAVTKDPNTGGVINTLSGISSEGKSAPLSSMLMPSTMGVSTKPLEITTEEIRFQVDNSWHGGSGLFDRFKAAVGKTTIEKYIDVTEPVGTEGFKSWFGSSIFKDMNGNPVPMYHGTNSEAIFDSFNTRDGLHHGAFFSPDTDFANNFNYGSENKDGSTKPSRTIPVYLKVERPFDYSDSSTWEAAIDAGLFTKEELNALNLKAEETGVNWAKIEYKMEALEVIGYDGVFVAEGGVKNIAIFQPENVRSIFRQDFTDTEDIRFQAPDAFRAGDLVTKAEVKSNFKATIRGTGHFGTGFYFFGKKSDAISYNESEVGIQREISELNLSNYNLAKGTLKLHSALKYINDRVVKVNMGKVTPSDISSISNITGVSLVSEEVNPYESLTSRNTKGYNELLKSHTEKELSKAFNDYIDFDKNRDKPLIDAANSINSKLKDSGNLDTASTLIMKELGFEGVDSRGTELDNGIYGTVVYDIKEDIRFQAPEGTEFTSNALVSLNMINIDKANASEWISKLSKGIKGTSRDIATMGLEDILKAYQKESKAKSIPKEVVAQLIATNMADIETKILSKNPVINYDDYHVGYDGDTYGITTPEGLILNSGVEVTTEVEELSDNERKDIIEEGLDGLLPVSKYSEVTLPGGFNYREFLIRDSSSEDIYTAPHYDDLGQNLIASVRVDDRVGPNGEKVLFVQEIQSDWVQGTNKGDFATKDEIASLNNELESLKNEELILRNDLVDGKFKKGDPEFYIPTDRITKRRSDIQAKLGAIKPYLPWNQTDLWAGLIIRKLINQASKEGYDQVAFVNGKQSDIVQGHSEGRTAEFYDKIVPKNINNELNRLVKGMRYGVENIIDISNDLGLKSDDFLESRTYTETIGDVDVHTFDFDALKAYKPKLNISSREDGNSYITTEFTDPNTGELFEKTYNKFEQYKDSYDSIEKVKDMPMGYFYNLASASLFKSINDKFPSPKKEYPNAVINLTPELKEATQNTGVLRFQKNDDSGQITLPQESLDKLKSVYADIQDNHNVEIKEGMISLYHFSDEQRNEIDPALAKMNAYSKSEYKTWSRPRVFFYTDQASKEGIMLNDVLNEAVLPIDRVYPLTEDPLNLQDIAAKNINKLKDSGFISDSSIKFEGLDYDATNLSISIILSKLKDAGISDMVNVGILNEGYIYDVSTDTSKPALALDVRYPESIEDIVNPILEEGSSKFSSSRLNPATTNPETGRIYNLFEETAKVAEQAGFIGFIYDHVGGKTVTAWESVTVTTDRFQVENPLGKEILNYGHISMALNPLKQFDLWLGSNSSKLISGTKHTARFSNLIFLAEGAHSDRAITDRLSESKGQTYMHIHQASKLIKVMKDEAKKADFSPEEVSHYLRGRDADGNETNIDEITHKGLRDAIKMARNHMDHLSSIMVSEQMVPSSMAFTISSNLGIYMTRRFKVHEKGEASKDEGVRSRAKEYLRRSLSELGLEGAELTEAVEGAFDKIVKGHDTDYNFSRSMGPTNSRDSSILMERTDLPQELLDLMGEITDPYYNYVNTVSRLSKTVASERLFRDLKEMGVIGKKIPTKEAGEIDGKIHKLENKSFGSINGLHVDAEMHSVLNQVYENVENGTAYRMMLRLISISKKAKTVWSVSTHARNLVGNVAFAIQNGHWRGQHGWAAAKTTWVAISKMTDADAELLYSYLLEKGVVSSNASLGEIRKISRETVEDTYDYLKSTTTKLGKIQKGISSIDQATMKAYQAEDDVWKIFGFLNERSRYLKAGYDIDTASEIAAKNMKNLYPNYDRIPKIVQAAGRSPLVGTFVAFNAEVLRTSANTIKLAYDEMRSGNPKLALAGATRLAGALTNYVVMDAVYRTIASATFGLFLGSDDEDEETSKVIRTRGVESEDLSAFNMYRNLVNPWDINGNVVVKERGYLKTRYSDKQTNPDVYFEYVNTSSIDGTGYLKNLMSIGYNGLETVEGKSAMSNLIGSFLAPYLSPEMTTTVLKEILDNDGERVFNPQDDWHSALFDAINYAGKKLQPGTTSSMWRLVEAYSGQTINGESSPREIIHELVAVAGVRVVRVNVNQSFHFKAGDVSREINSRIEALEGSREDIKALHNSDAVLSRKVQALTDITMSAWIAGVPTSDLRLLLKGANCHKKLIDLVMTKYNEDYHDKRVKILDGIK